MAKRCSPFLCMFATTIALAVIFSSSVVVDCSEVKELNTHADADDSAAIPDGGHGGWAPPAPQPGLRAPRVPRPGTRVQTPRRRRSTFAARAASCAAQEDRPERVGTPVITD
ncbi:hypothetical protein PVAP13_5NG143200 [Panicum virgatum]|uniref:Uncharacterized protein n=1 Tax=Panicum virgatum TaxID=38727 RepID=A0A8T0RQ36_PANVG|nr:hypothetical protein PVAP13_5NG143200 [Panicum virgatum]